MTGIAAGVLKRSVSEKHKSAANAAFTVFIILAILSPFKGTAAAGGYVPAINSDKAMEEIYKSELEFKLQNKLAENEYQARIENIYCNCKDGEIEVSLITFKGDARAKAFLCALTGLPEDKVIANGNR